MVLQVLNIVMGFIAALPGLRERKWFKSDLEKKTDSWKAYLGLVGFVLGVLGLLVRMDILPPFTYRLGASYPQTIPAILLGLLLAGSILDKYGFFKAIIRKLEPHAFWLGILGIAVGVGSILFGCVLPVFCGVPLYL